MIVIFVENLADPSHLVAAADHRIWSDDPAVTHRELPVHLDALDFPSGLSPPPERILLLEQNEPVEESSAGVEQVENNVTTRQSDLSRFFSDVAEIPETLK